MILYYNRLFIFNNVYSTQIYIVCDGWAIIAQNLQVRECLMFEHADNVIKTIFSTTWRAQAQYHFTQNSYKSR